MATHLSESRSAGCIVSQGYGSGKAVNDCCLKVTACPHRSQRATGLQGRLTAAHAAGATYSDDDVYRSIDIRVGRVPTVRTGKRMTLPHTTQPTTRTMPAGVGRIDIIDQQAAPFGSVANTLAQQAALPLAQASAGTPRTRSFLDGCGSVRRSNTSTESADTQATRVAAVCRQKVRVQLRCVRPGRFSARRIDRVSRLCALRIASGA